MNKIEHLLACVAEEAGEIAQVAGKMMRFGVYDSHSKTGNIQNITLLRKEVNDLLAVLEMICDEDILCYVNDRKEILKKKLKVKRYMKYAEERGTLR